MGHVYKRALAGFSISMPEGKRAALEKNPNVESVEQDFEVKTVAQNDPTGNRRIFADDAERSVDGKVTSPSPP